MRWHTLRPRRYGAVSPNSALSATPGYTSAGRGLPTGWAPQTATEEKAQQVFEELDLLRRGFLEYADVEMGFRQRGLDFSNNTVSELFYNADSNRDGRVTFDEWCNWATVYPNSLESLWFHSRDCVEERSLRQQMRQAEEQLQSNQRRREQLQRELGDLDTADDELRRTQEEQRRAAKEHERKRVKLTGGERDLIEEEIKMERQRDQMRLQEVRFQEVSQRFNETAGAGSPRRARDVSGLGY